MSTSTEQHCGKCGRLCVFKIEPEDSVTYLGMFWEIEHAKMFAEAFSSACV